MNIIKCNTLSFYNEQGVLTLNAKQFDTGRMFVFHIMDNDEPFDLSGCTAYLRIAKADGTQFQGHECCKIEGSKITIDPSVGNGNQILTAAGTNVCELHLEDADGTSLTTWNFNMEVVPRVHDGDHISSVNSYDILDIATNCEKEREINEEKRINSEKKRQENESKREIAFENFKNEIHTITDETCSYATKAESWTIGGTNTRSGEDTDNSKHYYEQIKSIAESFSGTLRPKGTIAFANIPSLSSAKEGDMYNITNQFTTTTDFKEGSGHFIPAGSNIYKTADGKWDVLAGTPVTGVKGDKESTYQTGNVNITPENIGALSLKKGGTINNNFKVNKESSTNSTGLTELDIHNDGKVAINTNGSGSNNNSLAHFDGTPNTGTITLRGKELRLYEPNISLESTSNTGNTTINYHGIAFKNSNGSTIMIFDDNNVNIGKLQLSANCIKFTEDSLGYIYGTAGLQITVEDPGLLLQTNSGNARINLLSNDVTINGGVNGYSSKAASATFNESTGETRLYTNDINIGASGDYFIEAYRNINGDTTGVKNLKLRGGKYIDAQHQSANIQLEYNVTNGNQIDFYANDYNFYSASNQNPLLKIKSTGIEIRDTSDDGFTVNGNTKVTGNLRLKGSGNYGNILNFGDSDYVHISEPTDDHLEIKSSYINFVLPNTNTGRFTINGKDILNDNVYASKAIYEDTVVSLGRKGGTIVGVKSFAFGNEVTASGERSAAFGNNTNATNYNSCATGYYTTASGQHSHAEGANTTASDYQAHAEGSNTTASGNSSHAEGYNTTASNSNSHSEGGETTASGFSSHSEGYATTASGRQAHAEGFLTTASNYASHVCGKRSKAMADGGNDNTQIGDVFVIGNGTSDAPSNALRVTYDGYTYGTKAFKSSGADYAEHIKEWTDGNPNNEDRVGYMVTIKNGLLCKANEGDYIAGITSGNPSVVGNADEDYYWKYERDVFNRTVLEDVPETVQQIDENGNPVFDEKTHEPIMIETGKIIPNARMKLSKNYNPSLQKNYIERKDRKEWDYVGMIGIIPVRDDGTCLPDHFCKCGQDGIATLATERGFDTFYVIERVSDNVVSVELR